MKKPTDTHIEKFVACPNELSSEEKEWIQKWIDKDQEIRLLADWFKVFYQAAGSIEKSRELAGLQKPSSIELKPFKNANAFSSGVFVLAAQTPVSDKRKANLKTIRTFVSEEHKTLIRILHDSSKNRSKVHVISEYVNEYDIVLIEVFDGNNITMVSDLGGTFVIPDQKISINTIKDWARCELHLPVSKVKVFRDQATGSLNFDSFETDRERYDFHLSVDDTQLNITFHENAKHTPKKLVLYSGNQSSFWPIEEGLCSVPTEKFTDSGSCLFFFN